MRSSQDMFKLKRPCVDCPFKQGVGATFQLPVERLNEIMSAKAFQCHKTVDYSGDGPRSGDKPSQCAGLVALQRNANIPNLITQAALSLIALDLSEYDPDGEAYQSLEQMYAEHGGRNG